MQRAKEIGMNWVLDIELSPISKKKYRVYFSNGFHVDYGKIKYDDFLIHTDPERRRGFLTRWVNRLRELMIALRSIIHMLTTFTLQYTIF